MKRLADFPLLANKYLYEFLYTEYNIFSTKQKERKKLQLILISILGDTQQGSNSAAVTAVQLATMGETNLNSLFMNCFSQTSFSQGGKHAVSSH